MNITLLRQRLREHLLFDSRLFAGLLSLTGLTAALLVRLFGARLKTLSILCTLHRGSYSTLADRVVERVIVRQIARKAQWLDTTADFLRQIRPSNNTAAFFESPSRLLGTRIMVLKSPRPRERGVIVTDYTSLFPVVAKLFDLHAISQRYHLVLEPGWSGYCDPSILCATAYPFTIFVEGYEPRDARLIERLRSNLVPVPLSTNWWVDHRVFRPLPSQHKDVDLIMVASWAHFKRHAQFFEALKRLKQRGHRLQVCLIGYPNGLTRDDVMTMARHFSVDDQVETHEWLSPEEVNLQFNRAKANVIWSRREGVNRAIIEGMFAGVPCVIREGFNYGYRYPYVNPQTGTFSSEAELPDAILQILARSADMRPRDWVMAHMSCQNSNQILGETIRAHAVTMGENWTTDLAVRVCHLSTLQYWDPNDRERFSSDYQFLASQVRSA